MAALNNLIIKTFKKARSPEFFEKAQKLRLEVFVKDQNVPVENETDTLDDTATHFLVIDAIDPLPLATGRMFPDSDIKNAVRLGRMAVREPYRGQGVGAELLKAMLKKARAEGYQEAVCNAQTQAMDYYAKYGFVAEGEEFIEENIPHVFMRCPFDS